MESRLGSSGALELLWRKAWFQADEAVGREKSTLKYGGIVIR
jgi:hypothetical protein